MQTDIKDDRRSEAGRVFRQQQGCFITLGTQGYRSSQCRTGRSGLIGKKSAWQIDADNRVVAFIQVGDQRGHQSGRGAVQSGAQQGIDQNDIGWYYREWGGFLYIMNRDGEIVEALQIGLEIGTAGLSMFKDKDFHGPLVLGEQSRYSKAISAIIALAAKNVKGVGGDEPL